MKRLTFSRPQRLVQILGVPYVQPSPDRPHEAEGLCATLYSLGLVDFVCSEDTDVAVYGAPLIRRLGTSRANSKAFDPVAAEQGAVEQGTVELEVAPRATLAGAPLVSKTQMNVLDPFKLMEELRLSKEEFVDFALLCGTDFTERIPL